MNDNHQRQFAFCSMLSYNLHCVCCTAPAVQGSYSSMLFYTKTVPYLSHISFWLPVHHDTKKCIDGRTHSLQSTHLLEVIVTGMLLYAYLSHNHYSKGIIHFLVSPFTFVKIFYFTVPGSS